MSQHKTKPSQTPVSQPASCRITPNPLLLHRTVQFSVTRFTWSFACVKPEIHPKFIQCTRTTRIGCSLDDAARDRRMGGTLLKTKRTIPVHRNRVERDGHQRALLRGTATPVPATAAQWAWMAVGNFGSSGKGSCCPIPVCPESLSQQHPQLHLPPALTPSVQQEELLKLCKSSSRDKQRWETPGLSTETSPTCIFWCLCSRHQQSIGHETLAQVLVVLSQRKPNSGTFCPTFMPEYKKTLNGLQASVKSDVKMQMS